MISIAGKEQRETKGEIEREACLRQEEDSESGRLPLSEATAVVPSDGAATRAECSRGVSRFPSLVLSEGEARVEGPLDQPHEQAKLKLFERSFDCAPAGAPHRIKF
jgi:hypothetical protein